MMTTTVMDWIRTITPLVIIAVGGVVGWAKMNAQVSTAAERLEAECARSKAIDKQQDDIQRVMQVSVARIEEKLFYIKETMEKVEASNMQLIKELRAR